MYLLTQNKMKKVLLVAAITSLAMSSCKKDYTCECSGTGLPQQYSYKEYKKVKKKDAKASCDNISATYKSYGADISCAVK